MIRFLIQISSVFLLSILMTGAASGSTCQSIFAAEFMSVAMDEATTLRGYIRDDGAIKYLRFFMPEITRETLVDLVEKLEAGSELGRRDRLQIALLRLTQEHLPLLYTGADALERIANTLAKTEIDFIPESSHRLWQNESGSRGDRTTFVLHAYRLYDYARKNGSYDENRHPSALSHVLKPPARRFGHGDVFPGVEIITQLDHITIINQDNGAFQIQRIDPELRKLVSEGPLVLAVIQDLNYLRSLPRRDDLVIFTRGGHNNLDVWGRKILYGR